MEKRRQKIARSELINIRVRPEVKDRIFELASRDGRTMSAWVDVVIERELAKTERAHDPALAA